ncbi:MAG: lipocalin family protein [Acidiferrobacterales bacterium]|jgi:apolipoprotein D and lipocalin family protein|nr:lipocalin family protein [Acidiferrobacterales bacterium]
MKKVVVAIASILLSGCLGHPDNVTPVAGFELDKYLGKWYEIARLDHSFERGLEKVTAEYTMRTDGGVRVLNRGYSLTKSQWKEAEGKAYFVDAPNRGYLKVSFFGPFYGSYVVFALDKEKYQYAFVSGPDTSYLWFLSRTPKVSDTLKAEFLSRARTLGFPVNDLIFVNQE